MGAAVAIATKRTEGRSMPPSVPDGFTGRVA